MPQFEVETPARTRFVRARDAADAVRRAAPDALAAAADVALGPAARGTGWCDVTVDGALWGRVRPRDRMRFRRD